MNPTGLPTDNYTKAYYARQRPSADPGGSTRTKTTSETLPTTANPPRTIPVCEPVLDGQERNYVLQCLSGNWISSMGDFIPKFEDAFARICHTQHAVACSNGTVALHLALETLRIKPGDEVIIPAFTLIVTANTIAITGATPVLVDVDLNTWCINVNDIEKKITPRTRAIVAVHMYGHPCDMSPLITLANKHKLAIIEDAAQAHGATYRDQTVGSFGDVGCFSFYANKIITTGEGGMITTNHQELADRARLLRNQAFTPQRFVHHDVGFNYRMTNIQAAIGLAQCERFTDKTRRKKEIARLYTELLQDEPHIQLPTQQPHCQNAYWMYGIVVNPGFGMPRDRIRDILQADGIETRNFFVPMNQQPVYQGEHSRWPDLRGHYPVSEYLGQHGFYLPTGLSLTPDDQHYIVERLRACRR